MNIKKQIPTPQPDPDDMLEEYDFSKGIRGKYVERFLQDSNIQTEKADQDRNQGKDNGTGTVIALERKNHYGNSTLQI